MSPSCINIDRLTNIIFIIFSDCERRCFGSPTYIKRKIATAITACIIPKENANCSGAVAIRTKNARGPPFTPNMKIIIKRRKEQHDQLKNQN